MSKKDSSDNKYDSRGRPSVFTDETLLLLKEAFLMGCTDEEACLYAGISTSPFYKYQSENKEFKDEKEVWKKNPILKARQSVLNGIGQSPELALKFLERKKKDEFSLRHEVTGKDGEDLEPVVVYVPDNKRD